MNSGNNHRESLTVITDFLKVLVQIKQNKMQKIKTQPHAVWL